MTYYSVLQCTTCAADILRMGQSSEYDSLRSSLELVTTQLSTMENNQASTMLDIQKRLERLEMKKQGGDEPLDQESDTEETNGEVLSKKFVQLSGGEGSARNQRTGVPTVDHDQVPTSIQSKSLRWEYEAVRDSVSRVKLPHRYRMNDSKSGINSKDKEQAAVLVRSSKFIETGLKLLAEAQKIWGNFPVVADVLDGLMLTMTAHMHYVQKEHNGLYVAGQFGPQAKSVFKSVQRNTSNLQPEDIEDLKTMVAILSPQQMSTGNSSFGQSFQRGGFRQQNGCFHPGFRSNFNSFSRGRGSPFNGLHSCQIPTVRENIEEESNS